eukprot:TRINITY_DN941_c1_g1_i1.p1 TRINITY_DN941_c1_g1~~TRINITY_DN941_c1_g1_i1.p1  ORF type:complete len:137 (+),score=31.56 TRINITY_DN941_c1_g1_i1:51-413(+)
MTSMLPKGPPLESTRSATAQATISTFRERIKYSEKYEDETCEYRHVILPRELKKLVPNRIMAESEWRSLGVQQSLGWDHYMVHAPEKNVLCFRRPLPSPSRDAVPATMKTNSYFKAAAFP